MISSGSPPFPEPVEGPSVSKGRPARGRAPRKVDTRLKSRLAAERESGCQSGRNEIQGRIYLASPLDDASAWVRSVAQENVTPVARTLSCPCANGFQKPNWRDVFLALLESFIQPRNRSSPGA